MVAIRQETQVKTTAVIWHSMTGGSKALAHAAAEGAKRAGGAVHLLHADEVDAESMLAADGYIFVFPENLAAISGVMKAFFDRCYYPCLGQIEGRPFALIVCAGSDGRNAVQQAERIATGWRLKKVTDSQIVCTYAQRPEEILAPKVIDQAELTKAAETGEALATGLEMGIY
jgi:multimeric flavodoxin WrbA